jgi:hypothetical protein
VTSKSKFNGLQNRFVLLQQRGARPKAEPAPTAQGSRIEVTGAIAERVLASLADWLSLMDIGRR